jgi:hypothetical protein
VKVLHFTYFCEDQELSFSYLCEDQEFWVCYWICAMKFKDSPSSSPTFRITGKHELFFLIFVLCLHFVDLFLTPVVCWWFTVVDPSLEYVVCSCIRRYRRFGVVLNLYRCLHAFPISFACLHLCFALQRRRWSVSRRWIFMKSFEERWISGKMMNNASGTIVPVSVLVGFCMIKVFAGDLLPVLDSRNLRVKS